MSYGRRNYRSSGPRPSRWMALRYAGTCKVCERSIPVGETAFYDGATRLVTCSTLACASRDGLVRDVWRGSPTAGTWVPGLSDHRVGASAEPTDPFARTRSRGYYGRDAGRCEDAPCCGCCS